MMNTDKIKSSLFSILIFLLITSCGLYKYTDARKTPAQAKDKARKNIDEGRGVSINKIIGNSRRSGGTFAFSSSNPLWRASLEILDFLPLATVDYSGGVLITDWYNDSQNSSESLKITVRFLSHEVRSDSIKIIVHKRNCVSANNCKTSELNSKIKSELTSSILTKAALLEKKSEKK